MSREHKQYCVYKHTFPNGKVYIGITCQKPEFRWRKDGSGYKPNPNYHTKMWNAITKYGWENVEHEILYENLSKEEAENLEIEIISKYDSTNDKYGYNISIGGNSPTLTDEIRNKISVARKGNNYGYFGENAPMYGKHHSDETKKKMSNSAKGKNNSMYNIHPTEEMKNYQREIRKDISKEIKQIDYDGNVVNTFPSIHYASNITGISRVGISWCVNGKQKTAGGYVWKLSTDYKEN